MKRNYLKHRLKRSDYPKDWEVISLALRKARPYCEGCGLPNQPLNKLTVHHVDGNPHNNKLSNLAVLCQKCHLKSQNSKIPCVRPKLTLQERIRFASEPRYRPG